MKRNLLLVALAIVVAMLASMSLERRHGHDDVSSLESGGKSDVSFRPESASELATPPARDLSNKVGTREQTLAESNHLVAAVESAHVSTDRASWSLYQWRDSHADRFIAKYQEAEGLEDRIVALRNVAYIGIANVMDSQGRVNLEPGRIPHNDEVMGGFSLNGDNYAFSNVEFPEYARLNELESRLFTKPLPGEVRAISAELEAGVLAILEEGRRLTVGMRR